MNKIEPQKSRFSFLIEALKQEQGILDFNSKFLTIYVGFWDSPVHLKSENKEISQLQHHDNTSVWSSALCGEAMQATEHLKLHFVLMFLIKWIANAMDDFGRERIATCQSWYYKIKVYQKAQHKMT